jgi:hypothetical protein
MQRVLTVSSLSLNIVIWSNNGFNRFKPRRGRT